MSAAPTNEAREASMSRVSTQDTILANLTPQTAASEPPENTSAEETQEQDKDKQKASPQDRIRKLVEQRNSASREAAEAKREAEELRARLEAMEARAQPMQELEKPSRSQFASDEEYIDALTDYKARKAIADREREQQQARMEAEAAEIAASWNKRQEAAIKEIPDYAEVVGSAEINIAAHIHQAIVESPVGPHLAYYFALNQDELKELNKLRPVVALRRLLDIEKEIKAEESKPEEPSKKQKSKAPEPISTVKETTATPAGQASSYEEYKRRRKAAK